MTNQGHSCGTFRVLRSVDARLKEVTACAQHSSLLLSLPSLTLDDTKAMRHDVPPSVFPGLTPLLMSLLLVCPLKSCLKPQHKAHPPPTPHDQHSAPNQREKAQTAPRPTTSHTQTHMLHMSRHTSTYIGLLYMPHSKQLRAGGGVHTTAMWQSFKA